MWHTASSDLGTHICIKLVNLVKQHPVIYLSTRKPLLNQRKNRSELNRIWENIAVEVGLTVEECKRRWKGLKDVYTKIRKQRLQEDVLGIKARKKWIYEDVMSFMKFPFEQSYQKALENFQLDCNDWKLEVVESNDAAENENSNDKNDSFESTDAQINEQSKTEEKTQDGTIEYLDLDLGVDNISETQEVNDYENNVYDNSQVHTSLLKENCGCGTDVKPRSRYEIIRLKPYQSNLLSRNKSMKNANVVVQSNVSCTPSVINVSSLTAVNHAIISNPKLESGRNFDTVMMDSPNVKVKNHSEISDVSIGAISLIGEGEESFKDTSIGSCFMSNKNSSSLHSSPKKHSSSSVELFFKSMAQTVMNLPMRAQAEIKMEICKIVTRAEIQYSMSQSTSKFESHKSKSKKS